MHASLPWGSDARTAIGGRADSTDKKKPTCGRAIRVRGNHRQPRAIVHLAQPRKNGVSQFRIPGDLLGPIKRADRAAAMPHRVQGAAQLDEIMSLPVAPRSK